MTYYRRKQWLRKNKTALLQAKAGNLPSIQKPLQKKPATLEVKGESVLPKVPLVPSPDAATVEMEEIIEEISVPVSLCVCYSNSIPYHIWNEF